MQGVSLPKDWEAWQLTGELGRGSYGAVYKAQRLIGNEKRESAIKIIRIPGQESDARLAILELGGLEAARAYYQSMVEEYLSEIQLMFDLKGITNIVSVEDFRCMRTGKPWNGPSSSAWSCWTASGSTSKTIPCRKRMCGDWAVTSAPP